MLNLNTTNDYMVKMFMMIHGQSKMHSLKHFSESQVWWTLKEWVPYIWTFYCFVAGAQVLLQSTEPQSAVVPYAGSV